MGQRVDRLLERCVIARRANAGRPRGRRRRTFVQAGLAPALGLPTCGRMRRLLFAVALAVALLVGVTADVGAQGGEERERETRAGAELVQAANTAIERRRPACQTELEPEAPPAVDVPVAPVFTSVLGVFRRAPSAAEVRAGERQLLPPTVNAEPNRQGTRVVRAPGVELVISAFNRSVPTEPDLATFERCQALVARELRRRAASRPAGVRREAARLHELWRIAGRPDETRPTEVLQVAIRQLDVPGERSFMGDHFDPARFADHGLSMASGQAGHPRRSRFVALVPDGVAVVELHYTRFADRGPDRRAVDHHRRARVRVAVGDNVVSVIVPRPARDALPALTLWRDATGKVVRVIRR